MSAQFKTLFSLKLSHEYYDDVFDDLALVVPNETTKVMSNGKIIVRKQNGVYSFLCQFQEGEPVVKLSNQVLQFAIKISNPYFLNFTDLEVKNTIPVFSNLSVPTELATNTQVTPTTKYLTHVIKHEIRPVTITLENMEGNVIATEIISSENAKKLYSFEFKEKSSGLYRVNENYPLTSELKEYYYHQEPLAQLFFSILEVKIHDSFYQSSPVFILDFSSKKEKLNYYIVAQKYSPTDFSSIQVADTGFVKDNRNEVTFERIDTNSFGPNELQVGLLGNEKSKITLFRSREKVTRRNKSRRNIQLSLNGQLLISNLPAPGQEKNQANFIIHLANP